MVRQLRRSLTLGFSSLVKHPLRSLLTMLGIVFGVGAVVAMLAIGEGASFESQERIKNLGSRNIIVRSVKPSEDEKKDRQGIASAVYGLTHADARRIESAVPGVEAVLPIRETRQDLWRGSRHLDGRLWGTVPEYLDVTGQRLSDGRFFNAVDMERRAPVCVIGSRVRERLFPYEDPVGSILKVGGDYYRVVGVLRAAGGGAGETGRVADNSTAVLIPFTTARERFGKTILKITSGSFEAETVELHQLFIRVRRVEEVASVSRVIRHVLDSYHPRPDVEMIVPLQLLEEIRRNARMFSLVLGMIAAISLLVGGIGIMNIMLATVTERTREIGIRRALGAKKRDIVVQFLSETVVLSVVGGLLGLGVGLAIPMGVTWLTGMKVIFKLWAMALAFCISVLVGLVFGIYPAWRAADMDPIQALRHE